MTSNMHDFISAPTTPISLSPSQPNRKSGGNNGFFFQDDGDKSSSHSPPRGADNPDVIKPLLESVHRRLSTAASIDSGDVLILLDQNKTEKCLNIADDTQDELKDVKKYLISDEEGTCVVDCTSTAICKTQAKTIAKGDEATLSIDDVSKTDSKGNIDNLFTEDVSKTDHKGDGGKTIVNSETDSVEDEAAAQ